MIHHFGTGFSTVKMAAKFEILSIYSIDCLDRTNVVQTAIAKSVLETQLLKLGLIPPEHGIPDDLRRVFQVIQGPKL